jgi:signal transduction histidine kinase
MVRVRVGGRLGIRQSLFAILLVLVMTMTLLFLFFADFAVSREIERTSLAEMASSRDSFRQLEGQQQDMLLHQTALLSELPSLEALMTTNDQPTIADAGQSFWHTSGSDLLALMRADGSLLAIYSNGPPVAATDCAAALSRSRESGNLNSNRDSGHTQLIFASGRFFEVATEPIFFSGGADRRILGYVSSGYELNDHMAQTIGRSPSGQVIFATRNRVIASTLGPAQAIAVQTYLSGWLDSEDQPHQFTLDNAKYVATSVQLYSRTDSAPTVYLVVMRSYRETTALLRQLDLGILAIGLLLLLVGGVIAYLLAGTLIRPLDALLRSTRQMGRGEAVASVPSAGPLELRELREAFEKMQSAVELSQAKLVEGERQATIGRMASSISHDLRHYLSPIYANAEFLASKTLSDSEREELLSEIADAARGMNDLLDSILALSRTGIPVRMVPDSITAAARRALALILAHPEAHGVSVVTTQLAELQGTIDGKELQRAVYNLLLNACQAARRTSLEPYVTLTIAEEIDASGCNLAAIRVRDNGAGVSPEIESRIFEPFVSEGKTSGVGLGLALVKRIAEVHGGSAGMRRMEGDRMVGETEFFLLIPCWQMPAQPVSGQPILGVTT